MTSLHNSRFTILLLVVLALLIVAPFFEQHVDGISVVRIVMSAILIAGIYAGSHGRGNLLIAAILGFPAFVGRWTFQYFEGPWAFVIVTIFTMLFVAFLAIVLIAQVLQARRVTFDTICGAACAYLLIMLSWAYGFEVIEVLHPGAFRFTLDLPVHATPALVQGAEQFRLVYFSAATITTLGYGDIIPVWGPVRALATLEAILGQFYLAVLIARLVGLHLIASMRGDETGS